MPSLNITAIGDFAAGSINGVEFGQLASPHTQLPFPPRFTFGTFPASLAANYYGHRGIGSVGVFALHGFDLSGVFLLSHEDLFYRCPELNIHEAHIKAEVARILPRRSANNRRHLGGSHVILAGPGSGVYGHWLVEYLPKLSLLNFAGYDLFALRYLLPNRTPAYVFDWLELFGIGAHQVVLYDAEVEVVTADEFLLPTILHNGCQMSPLFKDVAGFLRGLIEFRHDLDGSEHGPRIFLSRAQTSGGRALKNRARVEALALQAGFSLVYPEKLSLIEQVRLFAGAREVIGEYGSALHGSIFSRPDTIICALRGTGGHPGFIQSGMGSVLQHPTGYVFGATDADFCFEVQEEAVMTALNLVFGTHRR